ncbi:MAG: acetyl-CoA acetyltransferase [Candidatus Binatia bacterium]|nr:MAG: acetyl-CoA acetyltransferase [Candidatus Binatia bacterium]
MEGAEDRIPLVVGVAQWTQREVDLDRPPSPLEVLARVCRAAAEDTGVGDALWRHVRTVAVVHLVSWRYTNLPRALAEKLGAKPERALYTTPGGNSGQWLVNRIAREIAGGKLDLALVGGVELLRTVRKALRESRPLAWETDSSSEPEIVGDPRPGTREEEVLYGARAPVQIFPLFENALRAHYGLDMESHRQELGALCQGLSQVAARNPYAWFPKERSAEEISTVTAENRMISFPYPKFMNALLDVDQAAALLLASASTARKLGIPSSKWVYVRGVGDADDHWFFTERRDYVSSPALRLAAERALETAGASAADVGLFDLYSCFPCAVQIGRDMLGFSRADARPWTVTGGLPYHGGPGSNYTTHAVATMVEKLRRGEAKWGLVSGLGWYFAKHSVGVYSTDPPDEAPRFRNPDADRSELERIPRPQFVREAAGKARIETYTVVHDRQGLPAQAIVVGRTADEKRFLANTPVDRKLFEELERTEGVGRRGRVSHTGGKNVFVPE